MSYIGKTPEAAGSVPLMAVFWFPLRTALPVGFVAADGQTLLRDTYPDAWNEVNSSRVPIVTDALWNSDVTLRGSFTTGDGSTSFRIPDYNGKSSGSLGAVFLRGDGASSAGTDGVIQRDAFQGHWHQQYSVAAWSGGSGTAMGATGNTLLSPDNSGIRNPITDGANGTPRTAAETRPLNVTGCYAVKLFGAVTTQAMLDTSSIAAKVDDVKTRMDAAAFLRVNVPTGNGTTNTKFRVFSKTLSTDPSNLQLDISATLGTRVTVLVSGKYTITYSDASASATTFGITLNDQKPTDTVAGGTMPDALLAVVTGGNGGWYGSCSWTGYLTAGSVITPKSDNSGSSNHGSFTMTRIS